MVTRCTRPVGKAKEKVMTARGNTEVKKDMDEKESNSTSSISTSSRKTESDKRNRVRRNKVKTSRPMTRTTSGSK